MLLDRHKRGMEAGGLPLWIMLAAANGGGLIAVGMSFTPVTDRGRPHVFAISAMAALIGPLRQVQSQVQQNRASRLAAAAK